MAFKLLVFDWNGTLYDVKAAYLRLNGRLYPGTEEVLNVLQNQGYLLAIATAASQRSLLKQLVGFGIDHYFAAWVTGERGFGKPHPSVMEHLLEVTGAKAKETLMIGDSESDMLLAKNAKTHALAVSYGLGAKNTLMEYAPLGCIDAITELPLWLKQHALA